MKFRQFILILSILLLSCETNVMQVKTNDGIAHLAIVKNVEIKLDFESANGQEVIVTNNNARAVGVKIVKNDEPSVVVFSDSWINHGGVSSTGDTYFEYDWKFKVTIVVYKDLAGVASAFIDALGPGFLTNLKDIWLEEQPVDVIVSIIKG